MGNYPIQVLNLTEGARHERLQFYFAGIAVDLHPHPEGVEDRAAEFGIGARQRPAEVGKALQNRQRVLRPGDAERGGVELAQASARLALREVIRSLTRPGSTPASIAATWRSVRRSISPIRRTSRSRRCPSSLCRFASSASL